MTLVEQAIDYLLRVVIATSSQLFVLLLPGLLLALLMTLVAGFVQKRAYAVLGRRVYLSLLGWLGTTVHECGHALGCLIFRHRIDKIAFFDPDPQRGTLGYVNHSYNPKNPYHLIGNFFIGIAPILLGTAVVFLLARVLLGEKLFTPLGAITIDSAVLTQAGALTGLAEKTWEASRVTVLNLFGEANLHSWQLYVFLYVTLAVGSSITLSRADLKGAGHGLFAIVALLFLFNLGTVWLGDFTLEAFVDASRVMGLFYAVMLFAMLMNVLAGAALLALQLVRGTARSVVR